MAQWWERSPPTNVARVQIPASTPNVSWVCCWFPPLLLSPGTPLSPSPQKPTFSNSNSTRDQADEERLCGCPTSKLLLLLCKMTSIFTITNSDLGFPKPFVDIPFYMTKLLKEFKDRKMKSQKLKISQFTYRMLASLPEIIFPVTQPKLFDKVIVMAIGSSCFLLKYWAYPTFSWRSCLFWRLLLAFSLEKTTQWQTPRGAPPAFCFLYWTYSNVVMSMFTFAT